MKAKRIFITGGFGFIGSKLAEMALSKGYSVFLYDSLTYKQNYKKLLKEIESKKTKNAELEWAIGDTRNIELLKKSLKEFNPDILFHFAEIVGIYACDSDPKYTEDINYIASKKVVDLAEELNIPLIYNSTSSLYGNQKTDVLLKENAIFPELTDNYCKNKAKMELYIHKKIKSNRKFKVIILRPATVWGVAPRMRIELLPNHFTYCAVAKGSIKVSEPASYRAEMDIDDIVDAYFAIMNKSDWKNHFYNLGHHNFSKIEVAKSIKSIIDCKIEVIEYLGDVRNLRIDSSRFENDFKWKPKYSFEQTVEKVKRWLDKNLNEIEKTNFAGIINSPLDQWRKII